jgi:holo-[acyl-carrier protein] synthase
MSDERQAPGLPPFPNMPPITSMSVDKKGARVAGYRQAVGMDLVDLARIEASLRDFGARFLDRVFTEGEQAYALAGVEMNALRVERLGARFAAKEAALKALGLADRGVAWRDIEVLRDPSGAVSLALHGGACTLAQASGLIDTALSLSHDGGYAAAIVVARFQNADAVAPSH